MSITGRYGIQQKTQTTFAYTTPRTAPSKTNDIVLEESMIIQKWNPISLHDRSQAQSPRVNRIKLARQSAVPNRYVPARRVINRTEPAPLKNKQQSGILRQIDNETEKIISLPIKNTQDTQLQKSLNGSNKRKNPLDQRESLSNKVTPDLTKSASKDKNHVNSIVSAPNLYLNDLSTPTVQFQMNKTDNQGTSNKEIPDLLSKIRSIPNGVSIGSLPLSLRSCRFELPNNLQLIENLTPLNYLAKYCRLSTRRQFQFKRLFDRYRNKRYRFESSDLYPSIIHIFDEHVSRQQFDYLCELINLEHRECEFDFVTFAGILALCERLACRSSRIHKLYDDLDEKKHEVEICDFDCLHRKLSGLLISDSMRRLLYAL